MAFIRQLSETEIDEITDRDDAVFLGEEYYEDFKSNFYQVGNKFYSCNVTNDSFCYIIDGQEYDSIRDLDL